MSDWLHLAELHWQKALLVISLGVVGFVGRVILARTKPIVDESRTAVETISKVLEAKRIENDELAKQRNEERERNAELIKANEELKAALAKALEARKRAAK